MAALAPTLDLLGASELELAVVAGVVVDHFGEEVGDRRQEEAHPKPAEELAVGEAVGPGGARARSAEGFDDARDFDEVRVAGGKMTRDGAVAAEFGGGDAIAGREGFARVFGEARAFSA